VVPAISACNALPSIVASAFLRCAMHARQEGEEKVSGRLNGGTWSPL